MAAQQHGSLQPRIAKPLRKELQKPKTNLPKAEIMDIIRDLCAHPEKAFSPDKHIVQCKDFYKVAISEYRLIYTHAAGKNGGILIALMCMHRKDAYKGLNALKRLVEY